MPSKPRFILSVAVAATALASVSLAAPVGAKPSQLDSYCSPSGDICQEVVKSRKGGDIKFSLVSATASVRGDYTLCLKGPSGKECKDFVLEQLPDEELWADKVNAQKNFPIDFGEYVVKWKYMGERIGHKLHFALNPPGQS